MSKNKDRKKKRERKSGWTKLLIVILLVAGMISFWQVSSTIPQGYPIYASGVFYDNPTVINDEGKIQLPYSLLKDKIIVFTDIQLQNNVIELQYQGRIIPLSPYKSGKYLPLITLLTPSGEVIAGIRICEPCDSYSMHISQRKYLICDACGTKWDIETLEGVSGNCVHYPPPKLPLSGGENVEIDLSPLGITLAT